MDNWLEVLENILPMLEEAGKAAGKSAEWGWEVVKLRVLAEAFQYSLWAFILGVISLTAHITGRKLIASNKENGNDTEIELGVAAKVAGYITMLIMAALLSSAIARFIAPEYFAVMTLMQMVSNR